MSKVRAVLFDLYETLITEAPVEPTRAGTLAAALGLEREAYRREWKARRPRIVTGELTFGDALNEICRSLAGTVDEAAIQKICDDRVREKTAACSNVDGRIAALIGGLTRAGVRLAVVSNGFEEDVSPWPGCALAPAFACTAFSCREGVAKPDREIYRRALERLGVQPEDAVYIGDGGDNELAGAERAGVRALRATWFAQNPTVTGTWPELARPEDVRTALFS